jgi:hypothetical protein
MLSNTVACVLVDCLFRVGGSRGSEWIRVDRPAQLAIRSFVSALIVHELRRTTNVENQKIEKEA